METDPETELKTFIRKIEDIFKSESDMDIDTIDDPTLCRFA